MFVAQLSRLRVDLSQVGQENEAFAADRAHYRQIGQEIDKLLLELTGEKQAKRAEKAAF